MLDKSDNDEVIEESMPSKPGFFKGLTYTTDVNKLIVYIITGVLSTIFIILFLLSLMGIVQPMEIYTGDGKLKIGTQLDYLLFTIIIFTGVFGIYESIRMRRVRKIDYRFPDFIRDLAESRRAGMTFVKSINYCAKGNYGVLTPEIQKIARQISWGSSIEEALNAFAKRVNTKLIKRTVSLISEASHSGGNVADVLDAASKDARELKLIESERRASMLSYVVVVYVGMGVFLLIIVVLCRNLLPPMLLTSAQDVTALTGGAGSGGDAITIESSSLAFFAAAIVQSIGMGLVTGSFEEGRITSGVKHIFIMVLITWIVFKFIVMM